MASIGPFGASCAAINDTASLLQCQQDENNGIAASLAQITAGAPSAYDAQRCGFATQVGSADNGAKVIQYTRDLGVALPSGKEVLHTFDVEEDDYRFMIVTLNGDETFLPVARAGSIAVDNSLDLYLGYQQTPSLTPLAATAMSVNTGVFETIEIKRPARGEWHVLVHDAGVVSNALYQLTITLFK